MSTVEELQQLLAREKAEHEERMAALAKESAVLEAAMQDEGDAFKDLITRVTNLRVARAEYAAALAQGLVKEEKFQTGSDTVDHLLYALQKRLQGAAAAGSAGLLPQLEAAAVAAVTPYARGRPSVLNGQDPSAIRTTNIAIATRNDVRGVQQWVRRQARDSPQYAEAVRRATPGWETGRPYADPPATGMAAVPALHAVAGKNFHKATLGIVRDRSIAERADDPTLDVVRVIVTLGMCGSGGAAIADPAAAAAQLTQMATRWVGRALEETRAALRSRAPFYSDAARNDEVAAAVEVLLHGLQPKVACQPVPRPPPTLQAGLTAFHLYVTLAAPTQISATEPFVGLLHQQAQREYLVQHVVRPLAERLGAAIGLPAEVGRYAAVGVAAAEGLLRLGVRNGILTPPAHVRGAQAAVNAQVDAAATARVHTILHALSAFGTRLDLELALPPRGELHGAADAKLAGLRLARAFLKNLCAPAPLAVPMANDPEAADIVVRLYNAPTTFLEILNRLYSSSERLPASSRKSLLDAVVSPRSKLSLALRLYSELYLELFRPYTPASGVVLAHENGADGKPKAPPRVPISDMPPDAAKANLAVAARAAELERRLTELERRAADTAAPPSAVEEKGRTLLGAAAEWAASAKTATDFKADVAALGLEVKQTLTAHVDCLLPFGTDPHNPAQANRPLLYLRASGM